MALTLEIFVAHFFDVVGFARIPAARNKGILGESHYSRWQNNVRNKSANAQRLIKLCNLVSRKSGVMLPTEPDNSRTDRPRQRKRIGKSTLFILAMLFVAWALVAIPGYPQRPNPFYNPQWRGDAVIHTFGWPFVHTAKLSINPTVTDKLGRVTAIDIVGQATEERFDACLQSLRWSKSHYLNDISRPPTLMPARPLNEFELTYRFENRFWSEPKNWIYWDKDAFTRWYVYGLLANGLILLVFLILVTVCLEFLRRRRKRWFQLSLVDLLALSLIVGVATSIYSYETQIGQKQEALSIEHGAAEYSAAVKTSQRLQPPVFLSRLVDGNAGWKRFVPEKIFYRVTRLEIDTRRIKTESELMELIELLKSDSLNYVEHVVITILGEDRFFILDMLPTENLTAIDVKLLLDKNSKDNSRKLTSLKSLERFRELESLGIDCDWSQFEYPKLTWLKRVDFDWVDDADGRAKDWIDSMQELESVWVDGENLESCLEHLPLSIRSLYIAARSKQVDLSSLSRLTQLEQLFGYARGKEKTKITAVPELPNLKQLMLTNYEWGVSKPKIKALMP